jgi:hypothetical protein
MENVIMSKIIRKIIFISLLFFNLTLVHADEPTTTSCEYDDLGLVVKFDEAGTGHVEQNKYEEHQTAPVLSWFVNKTSGAVEIINELKHIDHELYGSCPKNIYACTLEREEYWNFGADVYVGDSGRFYAQQKKIYLFYSENNMKDNSDLKDLPNKELKKGNSTYDNYKTGYETCGGGVAGFFCGILYAPVGDIGDLFSGNTSIYYEAYKSCDYVNYTGDLPTYNLACGNLNIYLGRFNEAINKYKACSENDAICISKNISLVKEKEDIVKNYCKSILKEQDYDGGNEQQCLEACLENVNELVKAKIAAGIFSSDSGDCGFSARLLVWLNNIFRWIKYILPVLVIILGILDFIKAIGSDKEDEMKKAQKRFIIRLIAAALVFIVPLILEFILTKMGFAYDSCSLF